MRRIAGSSSLGVYLDQLEYSEAALSAADETAGLALPFGEAIAEWNDTVTRERAARRAVTRADAVVAVRDQRLDELTTRFGGAVLLAANQDRKSTLFRRFFPSAPSELVRQGLRKQCEQTRDRILPEIAKLDAASPLRAYESNLRDAVSGALQALDARAKARADRAGVASDVADWKEGVNRLRTTTFAELLKLSANSGHTKSWVEAFFPNAQPRASEAEAEDGDGEDGNA